MDRLARLRLSLERLFPERHLYVRSGGQIRGFVLSTSKQATAAAVVALLALWLGVSSAAALSGAFALGAGDQAALKVKAYYERLIADRQARLNSAVAELSQNSGSVRDLAQAIEQRHQALSLLLEPLRGEQGAAAELAPLKAPPSASPMDEVRFVGMDQERMLDQAESFAKSRADRLRLALKLAGLDPGSMITHAAGGGLGGPLIDGKDPKALAAVLDVDEGFASRIQHAAASLDEMRTLSAAADKVPLSEPTRGTSRSSGFGVRVDPFTGRPAFHSGLDFAGPLSTPIYSTAPGIVSFTGVRTGYGNTIEIDHGGGFKTRYAHLQAIGVDVGQRVAVGQRIGAMGSTGRSTGPHLHYEVWVDGRPQNPDRFLRAGEYLQPMG
jgi:murein DD-endopeptidase MepM/ murein hydrolase activator NlpD